MTFTDLLCVGLSAFVGSILGVSMTGFVLGVVNHRQNQHKIKEFKSEVQKHQMFIRQQLTLLNQDDMQLQTDQPKPPKELVN